MNVLLLDIDSKTPNLALHKVATYHSQKGDEVKWNFPLLSIWADEIYVSCVFTENRHLTAEWEGIASIGGSGYDLSIKLPQEIEAVKPRINMGFTTRGCIRNCSFCIVPEKEGNIHVVGDLLDLWDGKTKDVCVMDNNILALPEHFNLICQQAQKNNIRVDFNQGLDHRLLTQDMANTLKATSHTEYRFSFDSVDQYRSVESALAILNEAGIRRSLWYVLVGFNTTFQEDMERLLFLKHMGQTVFVQRYEKTRVNTLLTRWANQHNLFKALTFDQYLKQDDITKYVQKYELAPLLVW